MVGHLHRTLILRLTLGSFVIAGLLGLAVYFYEFEKIDGAIVASAVSEAEAFTVEAEKHSPLNAISSDPELTKDLETFLAQHRNFPDGSFLIAELYDQDRDQVAFAVPATSEWIETQLKRNKHRFPEGRESWYEKQYVGSRLFIQVLTPLFGSTGALLGYFEGVYEVSPRRVAEIKETMATALALVVLAVLATALLLYPIIRAQHKGLIDLSQELLHANIQTLEVLGSAIAKRDSDTHTHNFRVTIYAVRLAEVVGMAPKDIRELIKGSFLHDVGKIAISDTILLKPGRLSDEEFFIMKTHVEHGVDIVRRSSWLAEASKIVESHHEKFDGSGYPWGLTGENIALGARIFAIADVFDALTSERPYKQAFGLEETLAIMQEGAGSHFDPALLAAFTKLAPKLHTDFAGREDSSVEDAARLLTLPYFEVA
ncbi:MAG: HD-GYP domain-containing protein [Alphaproteobacteria bacterium]|nr:HD-GYP domain-containing protein [Alphaproteobacteria bacterium]